MGLIREPLPPLHLPIWPIKRGRVSAFSERWILLWLPATDKCRIARARSAVCQNPKRYLREEKARQKDCSPGNGGLNIFFHVFYLIG